MVKIIIISGIIIIITIILIPHHHLITTLMLSQSTPPDSLPDSPMSLRIDFAKDPALPGLRIEVFILMALVPSTARAEDRILFIKCAWRPDGEG